MYYKVTLTAERKYRYLVFAFSKAEARQLVKSTFPNLFESQKIKSIYVSETDINYLLWPEAYFNEESKLVRRVIFEGYEGF